MNATILLDDLRTQGVSLKADGECLLVDAPAGTITEETKATLVELKPKLLKLLTWERRQLQEASRRGLLIRWSEYPTWIKLHDPTTGEWYEVRAEECLPSVVETANKYRKKGRRGVSGGGGVLAHYGAPLGNVSADALLEFFLIAEIKGRIATDQDHDTIPQLNFRCNGQHAFSTDPEERNVARELLDLWHLEPDDGAMMELLDSWREELYGARLVYLGKRGRRARAEMEWLKFRLYLLALEERPSTVRGMYYRMVSKGFLPKDDRAYNLVQQTLLRMRREGLLPWRWITDSSRRVWRYARFGDMASYAEYVAANYRKDYWQDSPINVEVWCEKDAMQGVIAPVVLQEFGLELHVSKGQSSASYLYEAAESIKEDGRPTVVYILSDFDPAGFRIAEKIEAGLREHVPEDQDLTAKRVAVSFEQVVEYGLVTREVKKTDTDAAEFMARYGDVSCELEAMPANTLRRLLTEQLESHMDKERLRTLKLAEEQEREGLGRIQDLLGGGSVRRGRRSKPDEGKEE